MKNGKLTELGGKIKDWFLDLIYPNYCIGCGKLGRLVCGACLKNIAVGKVMAGSDLDSLWIVANYNDVVIKKAIGLFKYKYVTELKSFFNSLLVGFFDKFKVDLDNVILVPVPLHSKKKTKRGFNQSELFAQIVSEVNNWPIRSILVRRRQTSSQTTLNKTRRKDNVDGAFSVQPNDLDKFNSVIVLVDDVYTTGATMEECAKVLREFGFNNVIGLVIARKTV